MTMAFDTLKFAHRLEQVGVPRDRRRPVPNLRAI